MFELQESLVLMINLNDDVKKATERISTLAFRVLALRQGETSALGNLYDGKFTISTQLIKPNHLVIPSTGNLI